jgi:hypothetical protein
MVCGVCDEALKAKKIEIYIKEYKVMLINFLNQLSIDIMIQLKSKVNVTRANRMQNQIMLLKNLALEFKLVNNN